MGDLKRIWAVKDNKLYFYDGFHSPKWNMNNDVKKEHDFLEFDYVLYIDFEAGDVLVRMKPGPMKNIIPKNLKRAIDGAERDATREQHDA